VRQAPRHFRRALDPIATDGKRAKGPPRFSSQPHDRARAHAFVGGEHDAQRIERVFEMVVQIDFPANGAVELVERLGKSSFAHIRRADEQMLVAEIRGRATPKAGETATLGADLGDVHMFDEGGRWVELAAR
jgi:ABC-type sugar transport system ATPase subunit